MSIKILITKICKTKPNTKYSNRISSRIEVFAASRVTFNPTDALAETSFAFKFKSSGMPNVRELFTDS